MHGWDQAISGCITSLLEWSWYRGKRRIRFKYLPSVTDPVTDELTDRQLACVTALTAKLAIGLRTSRKTKWRP